ncbi:MAG: hypothetical protein IJU81_02660 [Bacteroidales bacterium]|nr:hypothetical protein [Bacteroidales bacterium]
MSKLTEIKSRLLQFAKEQGFKKEEFCRVIGIDSANFRGKNALSDLGSEKIVSILSHFSNLNPDWLMLGKGEMLRTEAEKKSSEEALAIKIISEKDARIEQLIRENERLLAQVSFFKEKEG